MFQVELPNPTWNWAAQSFSAFLISSTVHLAPELFSSAKALQNFAKSLIHNSQCFFLVSAVKATHGFVLTQEKLSPIKNIVSHTK